MPCLLFMRALERVTPPAIEPLGLAETKLFLRLDSPDEDLLILSLIQTARDAAESFLRRSLMTQQWKLSFDYGIGEQTSLPMGPVQSITSITATNKGHAPVTVDPSIYSLTAGKDYLLTSGGLVSDLIEILYLTGYVSAETVPPAIRQGMLSHIAALYADRGSSTLPGVSRAAYLPYREVRL